MNVIVKQVVGDSEISLEIEDAFGTESVICIIHELFGKECENVKEGKSYDRTRWEADQL